ncbi:MAG: DNA pilot protein [Microviridae sp.]|nr:MAG: DNA pilot protein [Microviridae sp.]
MWPAIIAAAGGIAGGLLGNAASAKQAAKNRDFQRDMSSTAHQREVEDLRAAGLNPILSGTGGMGASTPAGATSQQNDPISSGIKSGVDVYSARNAAEKMKAEVSNITQDTANKLASAAQINAQTQLITTQTQTASDQGILYNSQTSLNQAEMRLKNTLEVNLLKEGVGIPIKNAILGQDLKVARAAAAQAYNDEKINETLYGKILRYLNLTTKAASPLIPSSSYQLNRMSK